MDRLFDDFSRGLLPSLPPLLSDWIITHAIGTAQGRPAHDHWTISPSSGQHTSRNIGERLVTVEDIGAIAAGLISDFACNATGSVSYVHAGYHVMS